MFRNKSYDEVIIDSRTWNLEGLQYHGVRVVPEEHPHSEGPGGILMQFGDDGRRWGNG